MKLKLDENLGKRGADALREAGHDVSTIAEQGLLSAPDAQILDRCRAERRALVSLDRGLADPVLHNPADYAGIIVFRLPRKPKRADLAKAFRVLIVGLKRRQPAGTLWLVRSGRIRIFEQGRSHG